MIYAHVVDGTVSWVRAKNLKEAQKKCKPKGGQLVGQIVPTQFDVIPYSHAVYDAGQVREATDEEKKIADASLTAKDLLDAIGTVIACEAAEKINLPTEISNAIAEKKAKEQAYIDTYVKGGM